MDVWYVAASHIASSPLSIARRRRIDRLPTCKSFVAHPNMNTLMQIHVLVLVKHSQGDGLTKAGNPDRQRRDLQGPGKHLCHVLDRDFVVILLLSYYLAGLLGVGFLQLSHLTRLAHRNETELDSPGHLARRAYF